jgi:hypothetical protein
MNVIITGRKYAVLLLGLLFSGMALAQQSCIGGMKIEGVITDPTGAVIPGAHLQASTGATGVTDATGRYAFACVPVTSTTITADADGFAQAVARAHARADGTAHVNLQLVNTILSSGAVGRPVATETARRIELGVRFAF